jgi:CheY-like chemotaxis protein
MSLLDKTKEQKLDEHGFQYKDWLDSDSNNIIISPSGLRNFISNRGEWYNNTILKEKTFAGNEASTLGSLLHLYAQEYYEGTLNKDNTLADWKVKQIASEYPNAIKEFERIYPFFKEVYLDNSIKPDYCEKYLEYDLTPNIKLAGSMDFISQENGKWIIGDYKSSSKTFKDLEAYFLQLSVYSLLVELCIGIKIDIIRVVGIITIKEPKILIVEDKPNVDYVKQLLNDVVYSIQLVKDNPELISLIFPFNYYDMFNSGEDKKRLGSKEPMFKELDKTTVVRNKLKQSVFG